MVKFDNKARLLAMMTVTTMFFFAEIVTGYLTNSMALVADSFHMLSDVLSILIGYLAVYYSDKKSKRNTYDWARAEVLGAMANAVFLLALVFTIFVSAIQRLINVEPITQPLIILGVGGAGLLINIFGLVIFGGHAHCHSQGHNHSHRHKDHALSNAHSHRNGDPGGSSETAQQSPANGAAVPQMNMHAVFLHVLGDALGSVVVIISALVIYFVKEDWRYYVDPVMSLLISVIISWTTIPLLRNASMILLQNPPRNVDIEKIKEEVTQVSGVKSFHDLHVWQLSSNCVIATVHVIVHNYTNLSSIAQQLKKIFHANDIHSTTIQLEFSTLENVIPAIPQEPHHADFDRNDGQDSSSPTVIGTNTEFDSECLLSCISADCSLRLCCDEIKQKKTRESPKNGTVQRCYDNPGYYASTSSGYNNVAVTEVDDVNDRSEVA